jgi:hypothetical protein
MDQDSIEVCRARDEIHCAESRTIERQVVLLVQWGDNAKQNISWRKPSELVCQCQNTTLLSVMVLARPWSASGINMRSKNEKLDQNASALLDQDR